MLDLMDTRNLSITILSSIGQEESVSIEFEKERTEMVKPV